MKKAFAVLLAILILTLGVWLPGTEHMDKAYHQKMYHFVHAIVGMLIKKEESEE